MAAVPRILSANIADERLYSLRVIRCLPVTWPAGRLPPAEASDGRRRCVEARPNSRILLKAKSCANTQLPSIIAISRRAGRDLDDESMARLARESGSLNEDDARRLLAHVASEWRALFEQIR